MANRPHILLYEPRAEGHHPGWLRFITEDLLSGGFKLSIAIDGTPEKEARIREHLGKFFNEGEVLRINEICGNTKGAGQKISTVAACLRKSGADQVFLCAIDEVASDMWRGASFGMMPPKELFGRMGGIYHRPRFLELPGTSPHRWFKMSGFRKMLSTGWLRQLLFVDRYLVARLKKEIPQAPIHFLCDPCPPCGELPMAEARRRLDVPNNVKVFLFFGGGYRRKGLHLAVEAMSKLEQTVPAFLLCAGQLNPEGAVADGLKKLVAEKKAKLINRYVSTEEESLCFAASDVILLPYVHHFGTSGVLSRAMSAGKMVIASDEELLGKLTHEYGLGFLFPTENSNALAGEIKRASELAPQESEGFMAAALDYASIHSREAYRNSLIEALNPGFPKKS